MVTVFIEMIELRNFGHMITPTIQLKSRGKTLLEQKLRTEIMTSKHLYFKKMLKLNEEC